MKERLARWRGGEYTELWQEALTLTNKKEALKRRGKTAAEEVSLDEKNAERALRLAQQGEYTRAAQSLVSAGLAKHTASTIRDMQKKHPPPAQPSSF